MNVWVFSKCSLGKQKINFNVQVIDVVMDFVAMFSQIMKLQVDFEKSSCQDFINMREMLFEGLKLLNQKAFKCYQELNITILATW